MFKLLCFFVGILLGVGAILIGHGLDSILVTIGIGCIILGCIITKIMESPIKKKEENNVT